MADALWTYHFARVWQWQSKKPAFGTLPVFIDPDTGGWGKWGRKPGGSGSGNDKKRSSAVADQEVKTKTTLSKRQKRTR